MLFTIYPANPEIIKILSRQLRDTRKELLDFCDYFDFVRKVSTRPGGYFSMTEQELTTLRNYAEKQREIAVNARSILLFLNDTIGERHARPYMFTNFAPVEQEEEERNNSIRKLSLHPNPNDGTFTVNWMIQGTLNNAQIEVYTTAGKLLQTIPVMDRVGYVPVELTNVSAGVYLITLKVNGGIEQVERFVKY